MELFVTLAIVSVILLGLGIGLFSIRERRAKLDDIHLSEKLALAVSEDVATTNQTSSTEGSATAQIGYSRRANIKGVAPKIYPIW